MMTDPNAGITFRYNHLNLPHKVEIIQGVPKELLITYDALGRKLYQEVLVDGTSVERRDYINEIQLFNNTVESILHEHGRAVPVASADYQYQYHIKDHLGNVRVTFADLDGDGTIIPMLVQILANYYRSDTTTHSVWRWHLRVTNMFPLLALLLIDTLTITRNWWMI